MFGNITKQTHVYTNKYKLNFATTNPCHIHFNSNVSLSKPLDFENTNLWPPTAIFTIIESCW